jgi:hypothetical protein
MDLDWRNVRRREGASITIDVILDRLRMQRRRGAARYHFAIT